MHPAATHSLLGSTFRHPACQIHHGLRGISVPKFPPVNIEDEYF